LPKHDLRWQEAVKPLLRSVQTPALVIDTAAIKETYSEFRQEFGEAIIYYALKANPHPGIVKLLHQLGCDFEISSSGELRQLLEMRIPPERIISGNPTKEAAFLEQAHANGVGLFALDSHSEIEKLQKYAPRSGICVRLAVSNEGSEWPLSDKFGVEVDEAVQLLKLASQKGLVPRGVTFHVGSQCTQAETWTKAIEKTRLVWEGAEAKGVELDLLNIGGGFPIEYLKPAPSVAEIASVVKESVGSAFPHGVNLSLAPGRALVGEAGTLAATVIATAKRGEKKWLYLDVGVFNGLMESVGGIRYPIVTDKTGPDIPWVLSGPTCDSFDVIADAVELPDLGIGDRVYIRSAGAYTTSYASQFDGFRIPDTYYVE